MTLDLVLAESTKHPDDYNGRFGGNYRTGRSNPWASIVRAPRGQAIDCFARFAMSSNPAASRRRTNTRAPGDCVPGCVAGLGDSGLLWKMETSLNLRN